MLRRSLFILLVACGSPHAPPANHTAAPASAPVDPENESFGKLANGLPGPDVEKLLGPAEGKTEVVEEGATGLWVSTWSWPKQGISLQLAANKQGEVPSVNSIFVAAPSKLRTSRGIGIGAKHADVEAAYKAELAKPPKDGGGGPENTPDQIVVGSVYGGTMFHFENGVVTTIFVGAAAE